MVIKAKTDHYYFLFYFDINDNIKNDENEIIIYLILVKQI